ncbi:MAG: purine-nucleoside phosphorylase [Alphaproteobacteria bacterium]|nr:purine-nucleoside phosphorylase [Alphaproteobacteria bacterium]
MIKQAALYIKQALDLKNPQTAVILGSGLSGFAQTLSNTVTVAYKDIPNFPQTTVAGHKGELIKGFLGQKEILCLNGRFHLYEGHEPKVIADVIHILKELGIKRLIVTNAAGSLKKELTPGSLMLIADHINFSAKNPLIGANDERFGPRFPAMNKAYPEALRQKCLKIASKQNIPLSEGIYLMVLGPNFETAAEVRAFALLGADAVGMSTVPEVIAAVHSSMEVLGISVITNYTGDLAKNTLSHEETLAIANQASTKLIRLVTEFIKEED